MMEEKEVKKNINTVLNILKKLNRECNYLNFFFAYENDLDIQMSGINVNVTRVRFLSDLLPVTQDLYYRYLYENRHVHEAIEPVLVQCVDNDGKPKNFRGDWPEFGSNYYVKEIINMRHVNNEVYKTDHWLVKLYSMDTGKNHIGYSMSRFRIMQEKHNFN